MTVRKYKKQRLEKYADQEGNIGCERAIVILQGKLNPKKSGQIKSENELESR